MCATPPTTTLSGQAKERITCATLSLSAVPSTRHFILTLNSPSSSNNWPTNNGRRMKLDRSTPELVKTPPLISIIFRAPSRHGRYGPPPPQRSPEPNTNTTTTGAYFFPPARTTKLHTGRKRKLHRPAAVSRKTSTPARQDKTSSSTSLYCLS
ncbi:hypothetical protein ZWY2020_038061 [Hordeum vulgare]|nr:hypothetical protein ZWY2020_038061 [Hordeum vulgare]